MKNGMREILDSLVQIVELHQGISHKDLEIKLSGHFHTTPINDILEVISMASQDGLVKRIEYKSNNQLRAFYLPILSRLE